MDDKEPGRVVDDALMRITLLAKLLDSAFVIPGLNRRVGLDSIIGFVPGVGDAISAALASYIIWEARQLGLPRWKIARMAANVALDTTVGAIPVVGDVLDVFYKSNRRNLKILRDHLEKERIGRPDQNGVIEAEYTVVRSGR